MEGADTSRWYLAPVALALGEGVGVFFEDYNNILSVLDAKVQAQTIPRAVGPWEAG